MRLLGPSRLTRLSTLTRRTVLLPMIISLASTVCANQIASHRVSFIPQLYLFSSLKHFEIVLHYEDAPAAMNTQ